MKTLSLEEEPKTAQDYHCTDVGVGGAGWCSSGSGDGASAQTQRDAASALPLERCPRSRSFVG